MNIHDELLKLVRLQDEITHDNERGHDVTTKIVVRNDTISFITGYVRALEHLRDGKELGR